MSVRPQPLFRFITIFSEEDPMISVKQGQAEESVDLRTLRAIRVLRPLKLVSGIPSKSMMWYFSYVKTHGMRIL